MHAYVLSAVIAITIAFPNLAQALETDLDSVFSIIAKQDKETAVVDINGYTRKYIWNTEKNVWEVTPVTTSFSFLFENKPKGFFLLKESPSINRWIQGAAPYLATWQTVFRESEDTIVYWQQSSQHHDGTRFLAERSDRDSLHKKNEEKNEISYPYFYSGIPFTALGAIRDFNERPLMQLVSRFKIVDSDDGLVHLLYEVSEIGLKFVYHLDPQKQYALVRYERIFNHKITEGSDDLIKYYVVDELQKLSNGYWYPKKMSRIIKYSDEYRKYLTEKRKPGANSSSDAYKDKKTVYSFNKVEIPEGCVSFEPVIPEGIMDQSSK